MNNFFKSLSAVAICALASCGGGAQLTESQMNAMADSIAAPKIEEINAKATADCEARMTTEVKTMVDSIVKNNK
jgi:hypothetical protein